MGTRKVPVLRTDEEAEAFLTQDLSDLDFSQFKRVHFEFETKSDPPLSDKQTSTTGKRPRGSTGSP